MAWLINLLIFWCLNILSKFSSSVPLNFPYQFFIAKHTKHFTALLCNESDADNFIALSRQYEAMIKVQTTKYLNFTEFNLPVLTRAGVLLDITCQQGASLLTSKNYIPPKYEERILNSTITWLLWSESVEDALTHARKSALGPDSDVTLVTPDSTLYRLYKFHPYLTYVFIDAYGFWNNDDLYLEHFNYHDINFQGSHINCTVVLTRLNETHEELPGRLLDVFYHPELDDASRISIALIHSVAIRYNFTIRYTSVTRDWGYVMPNGSFTGMLGHLQLDEVDAAVVVSEHNVKRQIVASFLPPVRKWKISYIFRQPDRLGGSAALALPFHINVWACLAFSIPFFSILFVVSSHLLNPLETRYNYDPKSYYTHEETYSTSSGLLLMVGLLAQQGIEEDSQNISLRFLSIAAIEFFFLVIAYYNAGILHGLLSPSPDAIQNLDQLVESSFSLGYWNSPYVKQRIIGNQSELARKLLAKSKNLQQGGYYELDLVLGVEKIKDGGFAYLAGDGTLYVEILRQFSNREICSLSVLTNHDWEYYASPMAKRFSPLTDFFRNGYTVVRERGITDREDRRWWARKPKCLPQTFLVPVSMESLTLAYLIIFTGFIFSSVLLLSEICYKNYCCVVK